MMKRLVVVCVGMAMLLGCGKKCETYSGEMFPVCMNCFPEATVIVCIPCRERDNVEHCKPYCEECGKRNIVRMTQAEINARRKGND